MSTEDFEVVAAKFRRLSDASLEIVLNQCEIFAEELERKIKSVIAQKFRKRTGRLEAGAYARAGLRGRTVSVVAGTEGVPYGAAQEFGATIAIPEYEGRIMKFLGKDGDMVFTRTRRAYTVTLPERSYVRASIEEMLPQLNAGVQEALENA